METGESGEPRFIRSPQSALSEPADIFWDSIFVPTGVNGEVRSVAVNGTDVYVGGTFTMAGGASASHIARWNGTRWSALGTGLNSAALAIAMMGTDVYAGGGFDTAGGIRVNHIARWNGTSWSAAGFGVGGVVIALAVDGSDVYAGGLFSFAGGSSAQDIARWNGSSWSALGSGLNGQVNAIAIGGGMVYAGGLFDTAGGASAKRIARWDGSGWSPLGSGMNNAVEALVVSGTDLYAGGNFFTAGGDTIHSIAKWNGSGWSKVGEGMTNTVYALAASGTDLYAGGLFVSTVDNVPVTRIAKWNGTTWSALGSGIGTPGDYVYSIALNGSDVYAAGSFTLAGGAASNRIARWSGSAWSGMGKGLSSSVNALAISGSDLYVGGTFFSAGGATANFVAKWNGSSWSALGPGLSGVVSTLAVNGSDVYAGGPFSSTGDGVPMGRIAKWNGSSWSALGSGLGAPGDYVYSIVVNGSDVYAAGTFTTAGGGSANRIAKWNGSSWSALGSGLDGTVYALTVVGSNIYAGGLFSMAGGLGALNIARWNGSSWSALGSGINGIVTALAAIGSDVYAGGDFDSAGGSAARHIAKWNGASWSALGSGTDGIVSAFAVNGSNLYAGGVFTGAGGTSAAHIARWNGSDWSRLGSGLNARVAAMAIGGSNAYVGGEFTMAGTNPSGYIAKWSIVPQSFSAAPAALAYGNVQYGLSKVDSVSVSTAGGTPLSISMVASDNALFTVSPTTATIAPFTSQTFRITASPLTAGAQSGHIVFTHDGSSSPDTVAVSVNGTEPPRTIAASAGSHGNISPSGSVAVNYGASRTFTMTPSSGYHTDSLLVDGLNVPDSTAGYTFTNVIANHSIRAVFAINVYTIVASSGPNGALNPTGSVGVNYGVNQIFSITPSFGYHKDSILVDGVNIPDSATSYTFTNVTANHSIRAVFKGNVYTIVSLSGSNGSLTPSGNVGVTYGANQVFTATPASSYHTDSLLVDGINVPDSTTSYTFKNVAANHSIRAVFGINAYTIAATSGLNGSVIPSGIVGVNSGANKKFTISPDPLYHKDSLIVDGANIPDSMTSYTFRTITQNHTLRATFAHDSAGVVAQMRNGWNMVSVPATVGDYRKVSVFPTASSKAFAYDAGYLVVDTLRNGIGYWAKFSGAQEVDLSGFTRASDSVGVAPGWNLIGSISSDVGVLSVTSNPPGMVTSRFFSYNDGYRTTDTIKSGQAYWVKVNQGGKLVLSAPGFSTSSSRIRISPVDELPPPAPGEQAAAITIPTEFAMAQNYPNPFNPSTVIRFQLPVDGHVTVILYDVVGREVARLFERDVTPGSYSTTWVAVGSSSGIYFCHYVVAGSDGKILHSQVEKVLSSCLIIKCNYAR